MKTAVLMLAAGTASRMGRAKQLLSWGDTTLLRYTVLQVLGIGGTDVYVITGAYAQKVSGELNGLTVKLIHNADFKEGLGTSIGVGAKAILQSEQPYTHIAIALADQPAITTDYLDGLIELSERSESIVATRYGDRAGVPAVFPSAYFVHLAQLSGDRGASGLLNSSDSDVLLIDPPFNLFDIDTPEDYRRYAGN